MDQATVIEMIQQVVWMMLLLSAPILAISMVVGLGISILQAVTQIQEATITFVPKILAAMVLLVLISPWLIGTMVDYSDELFRDLSQVAQMR